MAVCNILQIPYICTDRDILGNLVTVSESFKGSSSFLSWYSDFFSDFIIPDYTTDTPKRVFISRRGDRALQNERQVEVFLNQYGFTKFYYEDISLSQQWSISRNAEVVVALHGAALASLAFNTQRVKLVELFHPGYVVDCYRSLMGAVQGQWVGVAGQLEVSIVEELDIHRNARKFATSNTLIDLNTLKLGLDYLDIGQMQRFSTPVLQSSGSV